MQHFVGHHGAVLAAVVDDSDERRGENSQDDVGPDLLIPLEGIAELLDRFGTAEQGHAAAGENAFFHRGAGGVQGVFHAGLLLLHVGFGLGTDGDDRHAAGQLGQAFLELFLIVLALHLGHLAFDLPNPLVDVGPLTGPFDECGVALIDRHLFGPAEVFQAEVFQLDAQILADHGAAGQDRDVPQHGLAAVAETRCLHRADVEHAPQLVDDQQREGFRIHVFRDDEQRLAGLSGLLEDRDDLPDVAQLLVVNQDQWLFEEHVHRGGAVDEVGGDVALVELHPVHVFDLGVGRLAFFDGNDSVLANPLECIGQQFADGAIVVGANRTHGGNFVLARHRLGHGDEFFGGGCHGLINAAADGGGIAAGDYVPQAFLEDGAGEHRGGGGAVAGQVGSLLGDFDNQLRAHVLKAVFQVDFLGHGHAVLRHGRTAEGLVDNHVLAGRAHRHRDGVRQLVHTGQQAGAGDIIKKKLLRHV